MSSDNIQKVFIIGISGSGKSTLARQLADFLHVPHFNLDDIFWVEKYTRRRPTEECEAELRKFLSTNESWVIEGVKVKRKSH